jgi:hypothetical protein
VAEEGGEEVVVVVVGEAGGATARSQATTRPAPVMMGLMRIAL